jgi:hypothetical protein
MYLFLFDSNPIPTFQGGNDGAHLDGPVLTHHAPRRLLENIQVQAMPTFKFFKDGAMVGEMMGADLSKLLALVEQHK